MLVYLLLPFWPLLVELYYKSIGSPDRLYRRCIFFAMLPMFLVIGLRASYIGADTIVYLNHFRIVLDQNVHFVIANSRMEAGYIWFVKCVGYITQSPYVFQLIYTVIFFIGYFSFAKLIDKEVGFKFVYFVITLGLFHFMLTGVRQNLAISICLFSVQFLLKRKYVIVALLVCLAFTFHKSSLLFVFIVLMNSRRLTKLNLTIYIASLIAVSTSLVVLQDWANQQFEYNYGIEETGNGGVFLAVVTILTLLSLIYYKKIGARDNLIRLIFNANIITLFFWILRLQTRVAERPSYYFMTLSCALYGYIVSYFPSRKEIIKYGILTVSYMLFAYRLFTNYVSIIPYKIF